ncbi:YtnP family quorum-quenching lactonase [Bacillus fonticola]|uniref:YtnP family quorum-quenching lactonase n=1 Tax=Bacillus fonticola TaxID=2728853 RepID=UPI0014736BA8|nr:MBL fold metallo-hydrolase [Bacillus fonticola]
MEKLQFGRYTLTWLNGGLTQMDGGAMFGVVPYPLWSKLYPPNEKNQIPLRSDPILIQGGGKTALIEGGIGNGRLTEKQMRNYGVTEEAEIDEGLHELGLTRKDIDLVLMTHMHFDHVLGLTSWEDGKLVSTFPNATIVTSAVEWNEMRRPNVRSKNTYWEENWKAIEGQVVPFTGEYEWESFRMIHTGGHSDGHSIIVGKEGNETLVHMADIMPTHAHRNPLWVLAYDDYPMTSIEQKQKWIPYGVENNAWFVFYHDNVYRALKWNDSYEIVESLGRKR